MERIAYLRSVLADEKLVLKIIKEEITEIKENTRINAAPKLVWRMRFWKLKI